MLSGLSIIWALANSLESAQSIPHPSIHPVQKSTTSSLRGEGPRGREFTSMAKKKKGLSLSQEDSPYRKVSGRRIPCGPSCHLAEVFSEIVHYLFQISYVLWLWCSSPIFMEDLNLQIWDVMLHTVQCFRRARKCWLLQFFKYYFCINLFLVGEKLISSSFKKREGGPRHVKSMMICATASQMAMQWATCW